MGGFALDMDRLVIAGSPTAIYPNPQYLIRIKAPGLIGKNYTHQYKKLRMGRTL